MNTFQKKMLMILLESENHLESARRFVDILYPRLGDPTVLLKALEQVWKAEVVLISTALQLEFIHKNVRLSQDPQKNRVIFFKKCLREYSITREHRMSLQHLLIVGDHYAKSGCTFSQPGKAVILNDDGTLHVVTPLSIQESVLALTHLLKSIKIRAIGTRKL